MMYKWLDLVWFYEIQMLLQLVISIYQVWAKVKVHQGDIYPLYLVPKAMTFSIVLEYIFMMSSL